ncbi:ATP-binding protein [Candidatus Woesearchaeota archaeon]|nr:ATP-binding protein [Candidatus Woesearchaeota archaeon]
MIKNLALFGKELEKLNPWWISDKLDLSKFVERDIFSKLTEELETRRIIQILGPRRSGKTTLIKQTISFLLKKINPRNILYYSFDDPVLAIHTDSLFKDILDFFLENIAVEGKKYVFFDEVHTCKDWHVWMKSFFDKYSEKVKFVITGSSSLVLQRDANLYLRGRSFDFTIYPLSFHEFLKFNNVEIKLFTIKEIKKMDSIGVSKIRETVIDLFRSYVLVGGFPEWFSIKETSKWFETIRNDIPKKAIYEDVSNQFNIRSPKTLENIFTFIMENQSKILSYESINEIAGLHRSILLNYIEYLKSSYLIIEIHKFAKSVKEQIKSKKKYLCIDQGLRNAIVKDYEIKFENEGFIMENLIGVHLALRGKTFYFRRNGEIDFVFLNEKIIPVEVKYSSQPEVNKEFFSFIEDNNLDEGIIITKDYFKVEKIKKTTINYIPAWLFLLSEFTTTL